MEAERKERENQLPHLSKDFVAASYQLDLSPSLSLFLSLASYSEIRFLASREG